MNSSTPDTISAAEALSAVWDGQADSAETDLALAAYTADGEQRERWRAYAAIRTVCQDRASDAPDTALVAAVMAKLDGVRTEPPLALVAVGKPLARAANDSVWRWKVAAGLLATVAVASIAWGLLGSSAPSSQLAGAAPPPEQVDEQRMIRNPELEALLAAHRQHGGVSVIQVSSGFLRNATYEVPADR
jgi:sigma-E factor negative regulatory protein RseA